jgi:hypothetical protein
VSDPGRREEPRQIPLIAHAANRMTQATASAGAARSAGPALAPSARAASSLAGGHVAAGPAAASPVTADQG